MHILVMDPHQWSFDKQRRLKVENNGNLWKKTIVNNIGVPSRQVYNDAITSNANMLARHHKTIQLNSSNARSNSLPNWRRSFIWNAKLTYIQIFVPFF